MDRTTISVLKKREQREVLAFLKRYYQKSYGTSPDHFLDKTFVARRGQKLLGAISIEFSKNNRPFELEEPFEFNYEDYLGPRSEAANFGRWTSIDEEAGKGLAYVAVKYVYEKGKRIAIASSKPRVVDHIRRKLELRFSVCHPKFRLNSKVKFFREGARPVIYSWLVEDWYVTLSKSISSSIIIEV